MQHSKNTKRFTQTVAHYEKYRPSYPAELIDFLFEKNIINQDSIVADIGSGTGIFSELLLPIAGEVIAVEPNQAMREAAEKKLGKYNNFTSVDATAENTLLDDQSVDVITVATAFHWFDRAACKKEFKRILQPNGWVLLLWNLRLPKLSPVLEGYEHILKKYCPTYKGIPSQQIAEQEFLSFFDTVEIIEFPYQQEFDLEGLIGRLRSTSYALTPKDANYEAMISDIKKLFLDHQKNGEIIFPYVTKLYVGKIS